MPLFAWVPGLRGPSPQIWHQDHPTVDGKEIETVGPVYTITEAEVDEGFKQLAAKYPCPI